MNLSKKIEINRSTLVSLKAELCRKQEEVSQAKIHSQYVRPTPSAQKKPNIWDKKNTGVDAREERDFEEIEAENNVLKRSREVLAAKTELYERLSSADASKVETLSASSVALVDFRQKQREDAQRRAEEAAKDEEEEQYNSDEYENPENSDDEWVDYTDCLGRTRRCLRGDLKHLMHKDSKLAGNLGYIDTEPRSATEQETKPRAPTPPLEQRLVSGDMQREALRAKWEQESAELMNKDNVHYQDILFDEVRSHGVSYYGFSRDEKTRRAQQEQLARVRAETRKKQVAAQDARTRREKQLRARLRAAANRKREREGLPPLPDSDGERAPGDSDEEAELERLLAGSRAVREPQPEPEPLTREERPAPAEPRLWDLDKEKPVMTQHEWNEKQRAERRDEFAPPSSSLYGFHSGGQFQLEAAQRKSRSPEPAKKVINKNEPLRIPRKSKSKRPVYSSSSDEEVIGPLPPAMQRRRSSIKKSDPPCVLRNIQLPDMSVPPPSFPVPPPTHSAPQPVPPPAFLPVSSTSSCGDIPMPSAFPAPLSSSLPSVPTPMPSSSASVPTHLPSSSASTSLKPSSSTSIPTSMPSSSASCTSSAKPSSSASTSAKPSSSALVSTPMPSSSASTSPEPSISSSKSKRLWSDKPHEVPDELTSTRGRGVEIAPPPTFEYHFGASKKTKTNSGSLTKQKDVESSIAAGLAYLRKQAETRGRHPSIKDELDFI